MESYNTETIQVQDIPRESEQKIGQPTSRSGEPCGASVEADGLLVDRAEISNYAKGLAGKAHDDNEGVSITEARDSVRNEGKDDAGAAVDGDGAGDSIAIPPSSEEGREGGPLLADTPEEDRGADSDSQVDSSAPLPACGVGRAMNPADTLLSLTGPAVLLAVRSKTKAPTVKSWQTLTLHDMGAHYLSGLRSNIGVSLGRASGGLCTIDCDDDSSFDTFRMANPKLEDTLQSHGARGGNFWVRIEGETPKSGKLKGGDGKAVGEWRADGNQTLLYGTHPSGISYRHNNKRAITIPFAELVWPDTWALPWAGQEEEAVAVEARAAGHRNNDAQGISEAVVEVMLSSIPPRPDRNTWMKISAAVRNALGDDDAAIRMLKAWSPEEERDEYRTLLSSSQFPEITFGTLVHHASLTGFSGVSCRFFYNGKTYCMKTDNGFIPLTGDGAVKQHLSDMKVPRAFHNSVLCNIRVNQYVDHMGPLAGHQPGLHTCHGNKVLVTSPPKIVRGMAGDGCFLHRFFRDLLEDPAHPEQHPHFLNWLAHCRNAVIRGRHTQSPALAFTGARGDGKSLAIEIISRCLGGRSAKAYRFLAGDTHFNGELAGVELLYVDDEAASKDHRSTVRIAQSLKTNLFAGGVSIEAKGRDAITLDPVQAIVFAVNDDPEHLRVLPALDDTMRDKIQLMKTRQALLPEVIAGRPEAIISCVESSLPGFLYDLDRHDMTDAYDNRGRLRCFWHPEIVEAIGLLSSEQQLLELVFQDPDVMADIVQRGRWTGTAAALEGLLTDRNARTQNTAKRLFSWPGACGTFLGRLAGTPGSGVSRGALDGRTRIRTYAIEASQGGEGCAH